jgi:GNAT superfamily N-acetyltransferase
MTINKLQNIALTFHPLTKDRWKDIEKLFGTNGACEGCWCMWWKLNKKHFKVQKGEGNKKVFRKTLKNVIPGIIAYYGEAPVGWCAIEPRENFPTLEDSKLLKRIDNEPVWSIVCFFVDKEFRKKKISLELIKESVKHAKKNKAKIVEAYPLEPKPGKFRDSYAFHGVASSFLKAGFKEVARNSETRPIMRFYIK